MLTVSSVIETIGMAPYGSAVSEAIVPAAKHTVVGPVWSWHLRRFVKKSFLKFEVVIFVGVLLPIKGGF